MAEELCNGCGGCCDPVSLAHSRREVEMMPPWKLDAYTRWWVLNVLRPISRREGLARAPHLRGKRTVAVVNGQMTALVSSFYECSWFDRDTRRCTHYDERPDVCRSFPRYDFDAVPEQAALPECCGYRVEQGKPVAPIPEEWQPVALRSKS